MDSLERLRCQRLLAGEDGLALDAPIDDFACRTPRLELACRLRAFRVGDRRPADRNLVETNFHDEAAARLCGAVIGSIKLAVLDRGGADLPDQILPGVEIFTLPVFFRLAGLG